MPPPPSSHRTRRIEDALSQLVDSLVPATPRRNNDDDDAGSEAYSDDISHAETAEADERRHRRALDLAWWILDNHGNNNNSSNPTSGPVGAATAAAAAGGGGETPSGSVPPEVINNAPDLIKRKLLRENASPDKAVRFSNLYSRLLTQPVLGQKWAILYLLYRIGESGREEGFGSNSPADPAAGVLMGANLRRSTMLAAGGPGGRRSPLMEDQQLDRMLLREKMNGRRGFGDEIAPGSSVSAAGRESPASPAPGAGAGLNESALSRGARGDLRPEKVRERKRDAAGEGVKAAKSVVGSSRRHVSASQEAGDNAHARKRPQQEQQEQQPIEGESRIKPTESVLLRDLPFNLQGLTSSNLEFSSATALKLPTTLPVPIVSLLHTLAEPCLLYRGLSSFVEESEGGLIKQSVRAAIGEELRSYLGLVATLEGEIRTALAAITEDSEGAGRKGAVKAGVTLKRCVVWMREATMALRLMSLMVEESHTKKGGQLISMIHGFSSSHGDPFVGAFAERLLAHVTRPFYGMLTQWIYDGELSDPYREFFVVEPEARPNYDPRRIATSVWDDKYKLDDDMVPTIMTQDFAKKVFLIGKSLNFIRYGCGDSAWVVAYSRDASKELRYGDTATLETSIDEAYKTTMARLIYLMDSKFKLFDHLKALKKYLLLGQGDFIALLMESLASNLDRPANSQYRHTLTAQLEHAIRSSNAQYDDPDVLRRLDARMLELSHGEIGWDCFTLEYKIDAPVDVVITPWASTQYLKVFNFLWRVKRVEFALCSTWRRCMTGARGVLGNVDDKVGQDWKRVRCVIAEMIHFISQLQYYILFEVIESSWDQLQVAMSKPGCTLDDIIDAHTNYLNAITHKGLLGSSSSRSHHSSSTSSSSINSKEESFLSQLHHILKIMLAFKDAVDGLYSFSVAEFTRRQEFSAKIETRTAQGRWGLTEKDLLTGTRPSRSNSARKQSFASTTASPAALDTPLSSFNNNNNADATPLLGSSGGGGGGLLSSGEDHLLPSLRTRLRDLSADFRSRLVTLLCDLAYQPDVDMRFLGVVMNFNDVYQVSRRRRGGTGASGKERRKGTTTTTTTTGTGTGMGTGEDGAGSAASAGGEKEREKAAAGG
ncbi:hypothetical protein AJ80_04337 [Polytolypa hystricis UAMH7299]|uniref:Spindle pole body component n=1 Tax=Polytolypa hystricis (strain UAMH7299) TaxID=1447883 RepID=A0A2B7YE80_POLH7|nr:hypothetical protein AJ80_04337 [Polytolypa hystricis UAMH7299]